MRGGSIQIGQGTVRPKHAGAWARWRHLRGAFTHRALRGHSGGTPNRALGAGHAAPKTRWGEFPEQQYVTFVGTKLSQKNCLNKILFSKRKQNCLNEISQQKFSGCDEKWEQIGLAWGHSANMNFRILRSAPRPIFFGHSAGTPGPSGNPRTLLGALRGALREPADPRARAKN